MDKTLQPAIGFVGLGTMGGAIARCLIGRGYSLAVYDYSSRAVETVAAAGATAMSSAEEVIAHSDVIFTSLPTPEVVTSFWQENAPSMSSSTIAVDTSTVDPRTSRHVESLIKAQGARFVAATVGKTPAHAEIGEVPFFVGGDADAKKEITPILEAISSDTFDMGTVEGAVIFKLISNLVGMTNLVALAEGYAMAKSKGISDESFDKALRTTGAWSVQADMRLPLMLADEYSTKFAVDLAAKDIRLSVDAAARDGVPTPTAAAALGAYLQTSALGLGGDDAAAVLRAIGVKKPAE